MTTTLRTQRSASHAAVRADQSAQPDSGWWNRTLALASLGCVLLWAALPPLSLGHLGWLAPVPWLVLVRQECLAGRRPYAILFACGFAFWLAALYWLTLPHWATAFGWLALSAYLAIYLPLFVGLSRVAVHQLRVPLLIAAPVMYVGLELARAHLLSGFAMAALSHTQIAWPIVLQIADLAGPYAVSGVMVLVAAALARMYPLAGSRIAWWPLAVVAVVLAAVLSYGRWRLSQDTTRPGPTIALVQGSIDIEMKHDPALKERIFDEYYQLSRRAVAETPKLDLIVWPETMFCYTWYLPDEGLGNSSQSESRPEELAANSRRTVETTVASLGAPCLFGIDTMRETDEGIRRFNSGLFTDRAGNAVGRYDKCHLVPFGEYVPGAQWFPWLYRLTPLPNGLSAGEGPQSVSIDGVRYSANICYENTIPQLIRSQVAGQRDAGREPDVLVNLTNDGWFWGSSELDMHLACAVLRAIECRKPFVIAANTGFSAWIDSNGRILDQGRRRATDLIVAHTRLDNRHSPYLRIGDLAAWLCLGATVGVAGLAIVSRRRSSPGQKPPSTPA